MALFLRSCFFLLLMFLLAKPTTIKPVPQNNRPWAVLLDSSGSMRVKDPDERFDKAKKVALDIARKSKDVGLYSFSNDVSRLEVSDFKTLKSIGSKTNLALALKTVLSSASYRGAIVLTDGRSVGGTDPVSVGASLGFPLIMVGVGSISGVKDVAVTSVQAPPFAFKNTPLSLTVNLSVTGYKSKELSVRLLENGQVLGIQTVKVTQSEADISLSFTWTPGRVGSRQLKVEASSFSDEATKLNNHKNIVIDVGRDRFRVLYICGESGPEYGFLRHQFKADPAVELVTFVILRSAKNVINVKENELSLIPFPTQDVLINQMASFDLVVFEEFNFQQFGLLPSLVYAIRQKVQDGGSFLLMGGPVAFGRGSPYALPGIKEMIPVELGGDDVITAEGEFKLLPAIINHPVFRLDANAERNKAIWDGVPSLDGVTLPTRAKEGASVLGIVKVNGRQSPVLAAWKHGKGRVATLSTRTTWRWSMLDNKENVPDVYQQFWKNMVLWLTHADEFKNVRIGIEGKTLRLEEPSKVRVMCYDDYFQPLSNVDVKLDVRLPDGKKMDLDAQSESSGVYSGLFKPLEIGPVEFSAVVSKNNKRLGTDRISLHVLESHFEDENLKPDFELMREMAHTTLGKFLFVDQFSVENLNQITTEINKKSGKKILWWNSPWIFSILLCLLLIEWFWRRWKGTL